MSSFWDDLPRGAPICLIVFIGTVIILTGLVFQRFISGLASVAFFFLVILFAVVICIYGIKQGVLD
ncbi:hypothetical protein EU528_15135 [Candidatus Thorarchaeota archaeon]|nr:MAG: hypothetical protein EU528_15135 [Candidatus Thorarchaeota archaeon]